jgi:hypothetical protein
MSLWSFQGARGARARPTEKNQPSVFKPTERAGLSKLNSVRPLIVEVDVISRRAELPDGSAEIHRAIEGLSAYRSQELRIP